MRTRSARRDIGDYPKPWEGASQPKAMPYLGGAATPTSRLWGFSEEFGATAMGRPPCSV